MRAHAPRVAPAVAIAALLLAVCAPATAFAQQTGDLKGRVIDGATGRPLEAVVVVATSPAAQGEQFSLTEADGTFLVALLPVGTYSLRFTRDGYEDLEVPDVPIDLGEAHFVELELTRVPVGGAALPAFSARARGRASAHTIDVSSVETGTTLDRDLLFNTPTGRTYTDALRITPGATVDRTGVSVFGATGLENTYIIEGMNTTGVGIGNAAADLNLDFFEQVEIKTAGYMPEYGRSTGGIFNLVLRSGSNEFHGDVFVNASPGFLRAPAEQIVRLGESIGRQDDPLLDVDVGFAIGGPIIKDRLWFFVGFDPRFELTAVDRIVRTRVDANGDGIADLDPVSGGPLLNEAGRTTYHRNRTTWRFASKLTWSPAAGHRISLSFFGNPSSLTGVLREAATARSSNGVNGTPDYFLGESSTGSYTMMLGYTGQFSRRFRIEAFAGYHLATDTLAGQGRAPRVTQSYPGSLDLIQPGACPVADPDTTDGFTPCLVSDYSTGGFGGEYDETLDRLSGGIKLTHTLRHHTVRYGIETELKGYTSTRGYSGGYVETRYGASALDDPYNLERDSYATNGPDGQPSLFGVGGNPRFSADVQTLTLSAYLQDTWQISRQVSVAGGVRWDFERFADSRGEQATVIPDEIAPRLGISVDPSGTGRMRFYSSVGAYYESVPLQISQRSFSGEGTVNRFIDDAGAPLCFDSDGNVVPTGTPGCTLDPYGLLGGENSPVARSIGGQYNGELVLGAEYEVSRRWVIGSTLVFRRLMRAIEDVSPDGGNSYFIANPGVNECDFGDAQRDALSGVCTDAAGNYDAGATFFNPPTRDYMGVTLTVRKRLSDHFQIFASYTLSTLRGNYTGLYSADNDQVDPNISSQYDLPSLNFNRFGPLPNDHPHQLKLSASYELGGLSRALRGLTIGVRYDLQSGSPINYLGRHPVYGRREVFILPRGEAGRTPLVSQLDAFICYDVRLGGTTKLNLNLTVFNVSDSQTPLLVNQEYTTETIAPQAPGTPLTGLLNAAGDPVTVNPSFGSPLLRQLPTFVRIGARLTF